MLAVQMSQVISPSENPHPRLDAAGCISQISHFLSHMSDRTGVLRPADADYWDQEFYIDGEGKGQVYEWYTGFEVHSSIAGAVSFVTDWSLSP